MKEAATVLLMMLSLAGSARAADEMPKRKPGLWEIRVEGQGANRTTQQCTDESTDTDLQQMAGQIAQGCSKQETRRQGSAYVTGSDCRMGASRIVSKGVFRGDFSSRFEGEVTATFDPPLMGRRGAKTKISARWLGPCRPDQKPGDMILPDGRKINLESLRGLGVNKMNPGEAK